MYIVLWINVIYFMTLCLMKFIICPKISASITLSVVGSLKHKASETSPLKCPFWIFILETSLKVLQVARKFAPHPGYIFYPGRSTYGVLHPLAFMKSSCVWFLLSSHSRDGTRQSIPTSFLKSAASLLTAISAFQSSAFLIRKQMTIGFFRHLNKKPAMIWVFPMKIILSFNSDDPKE